MKLTAQQILDKLVNEDQILTQTGQIKFFLGDVEIIVKQRDVVGNIMQEWLQGWLEHNDIEYAVNENTQMPPDFFLLPEDRRRNLLEVKAFNRNAGPGFDIADFRMYQEEIIDKPYMLDVDYLIFGYEMSDDGVVTIRDVWLKKVWEITRRMKDWSINLQIKEGVVHKIRPGIWYTDNTNSSDYSIFTSLEHFISAIEQAVYQNDKTHDLAPRWKTRFLAAYYDFYNVRLNIPRWYEIEDLYDLKKLRKIQKAREALTKAQDQEQKQIERLETLRSKLNNAILRNKQTQIEKLQADITKAEEKLVELQTKIAQKEHALVAAEQ